VVRGLVLDAVYQRQKGRLAIPKSRGYTFGMKIAVSIPDEVYEGAERLARSAKKSRSRLYCDALREYLARHAPDEVTEAMNKAVAEVGKGSDPFVVAASRRVLERSEW
jgi:metal-responsive CopG/Arc/MetJ family transcriptional regulator